MARPVLSPLLLRPLLVALLPALAAAVESARQKWFLGWGTSHTADAEKVKPACTELINRGTHFGIEVEVGTPGQKFEVIADTGSNTLIVPSCVCQKQGRCSRKDRCFRGTNRSSSFSVPLVRGEPQAMYLSFGSGTITGVLVKDNVRIGRLVKYMNEGFLLMTNKELNFDFAFEGILGLGIPALQDGKLLEANKTSRKAKRPSRGSADAGEGAEVKAVEDAMQKALKNLGKVLGGGKDSPFGGHLRPVSSHVSTGLLPDSPPGFLEQAGVGRFSMCFNDGASGVLRLGTAPEALSHGSVGKEHWGVDFRGITVGAAEVALDFCSVKHMRRNQETPCGAIPDSGTTMITGPKADIERLYAAICDAWPRCQRNHTALLTAAKAAEEAATKEYGFNPFDFAVDNTSKSDVLIYLLDDCEQWLDKDAGLGELPDLKFKVVGTNGTEQTLVLPGHGYIMESVLKHATHTKAFVKWPFFVGKAPVGNSTNTSLTTRKVCSPAFEPMEYNTQKNGPVWIFGTPFFYEYTVGFDTLTKPPSVSFKATGDVPCGACDSSATGLLSSRGRRPRWLPGAPRQPTGLDVGRPL